MTSAEGMDPLTIKRETRRRENVAALAVLHALDTGPPSYALLVDGMLGHGSRWVPRREVE